MPPVIFIKAIDKVIDQYGKYMKVGIHYWYWKYMIIGILSKARGKELTPLQCEKELGKFPRKGISCARNQSGGKLQLRKRNRKMASCHCWFTH